LFEADEVVDHAFQQAALFAEGLRPLGVVPDFRVFQFLEDFGQAFFLDLEVKDTP
jgi:hypothetical protein